MHGVATLLDDFINFNFGCFVDRVSGVPEQLHFKLVDFGFRGVHPDDVLTTLHDL